MSSKFNRARSATAPIVADSEAISATSEVKTTTAATDTRYAELEKQLAKVTQERDALSQDVELLCAQNSSSIFDSSMVLSERVFSAEKELTKTKAQLKAVSEERDSMREDLRGHRDSKRQADNSWREERSRAEKLEKELRFYQEQSARAMADRDQMTWEAEELRRNTLEMESRVRDAESQAETATTLQSEAEAQLKEARARIQGLEVKARDCETIPGLWKHIEESTKQINELKAAQDGLHRSVSIAKHDNQDMRESLSSAQQKVVAAEKEADEVRAKAHAGARAAASKIKNLEARVAELEGMAEALDARVEEAEGQLAAAQAELETVVSERKARTNQLAEEHAEALASAEASHKAEIDPLQAELAETKNKLASMTSEFKQASTEKVQALMRVSQAEQGAEQAFKDAGDLLGQIADLRDKVNQASQEKVAALMQVASLKEQVKNGGRSPAGNNAASKTSGWRLWGSQPVESPGKADSGELPAETPPGDLREAINQLHDLHQRMADLGSLATSSASLRQQVKQLHIDFKDNPTHLRRKELVKKATELEETLVGIVAEHKGLLDQASTSETAKALQFSPEKGSEKRKRVPDDAAAAAELVAALQLVLQNVQQR